MRWGFNSVLALAGSLLLLACSSGGTSSTPSGGTTNTSQRLYIADDRAAGQIQVFALPLTAAATPAFTIPHPSGLSVALNSNGDLAAVDIAGAVKIFPAPLSATVAASAAFTSPGGSEQLAVAPSGKLFACTQGAKVNVFTPPFTNATAFTSQITDPGVVASMGAAFDAQGNLYLAGGGNHVDVLPNEGSAAASVSVIVPGTPSLRQIALGGGQLFLANVAGTTGSVLVYNLPLTATSTPAATITIGTNSPESVAVDASGNLYVGNLGNGTVTVYAPPFSSSSAPTLTLSTPATIFGIAVGK